MSKKADFPYLHGFSPVEQARLRHQARFAEFSIYQDVNFSNLKKIIEVGCGVGAQTEILLRRFPELHVTGIDLSEPQLAVAKESLKACSWADGRYDLHKMSAADLDFESDSFDGAFLCWILEHIPNPAPVLSEVRRVVKPGGKIVINEVNNSSFFLEPYSPHVWQYWMAFNDCQDKMGGDPFIGLKLGNMLHSQGFKDIETSVKTWFFDNRLPETRKEYIEYWTNLLLSAADHLIEQKFVTKELVEEAKKELRAVSKDSNAVFFYSFVQAKARVY